MPDRLRYQPVEISDFDVDSQGHLEALTDTHPCLVSNLQWAKVDSPEALYSAMKGAAHVGFLAQKVIEPKFSAFGGASEEARMQVSGGRFHIADEKLFWQRAQKTSNAVGIAVIDVLDEGDELIVDIGEALPVPGSAPWLNNMILEALQKRTVNG